MLTFLTYYWPKVPPFSNIWAHTSTSPLYQPFNSPGNRTFHWLIWPYMASLTWGNWGPFILSCPNFNHEQFPYGDSNWFNLIEDSFILSCPKFEWGSFVLWVNSLPVLFLVLFEEFLKHFTPLCHFPCNSMKCWVIHWVRYPNGV